LPEDLVKNLASQYSFDLTTSYYDRINETYEEFYFTSVRFSDVPFVR